MKSKLPVLTKTDPELQRKKALAKVYDLLIRLAEEKDSANIAKDKQKTGPLKKNIPLGR